MNPAIHSTSADPEQQVIAIELPMIQEIVARECWLAGERRGCRVAPTDPEVQLRVAEILLAGTGAYLRQVASALSQSNRK